MGLNEKIDALCDELKEKYKVQFFEWDSDVAEERFRVVNEIIKKIQTLKEG